MKHIPINQFWAVLSRYLRPLWRQVALLAFLIFSGIGLQVLNPQIIRYFIDTAQVDGPLERLLWAGGFFLAGAIFLQITTVASTYVGEDIGWTATNKLREDLALHCMQLDMTFHNDRTPGEMIERVDGDVANLAIFFAQFVVRVIGSLLLLFGVLIALAFEDWRICLVMAVYAAFTLWGLIRMRDIATPYWKRSREVSAELFGFIEEQLAGTEDIRSSGARPFVLRDLFRFNYARLSSERRAGIVNTFMVMTWMGLYTLGQAIAMVAGSYFFQGGVLTIGAVFLIISYTDAIFRPLEQITNEIQNLQKAAASIDRIQELIAIRPTIVDGERGTLPAGPLGVRFADVTFAYQRGAQLRKIPGEDATEAERTEWLERPEHATPQLAAAGDSPGSDGEAPEPPKTVLRDLSFAIEPGEVLGLLGRTGSGKTTITRLLFRLYEVQSGQIALFNAADELPLDSVALADLRSRVGIVTQDVQLFKGTVRDNLTFFDRTIGDAQILAAIRALDMQEWLDRLPLGLDTEMASGGTGLSAGEAQLLAFTRVFLRNPGLVILDEASSRLDPATEQHIETAIDQLLHERTGIIIAHRLATVHRADKILILEDGAIREYGRYRDLIADPSSRFSQLLRAGMEEVLA